MDKKDVCSELVVRSNIIAGTYHAGLGMDGLDCSITAAYLAVTTNEPSGLSYYGNVAHSIEGDGFVITNYKREDKNNDNCYLAGWVCAYKNAGYGLITY